MNLSSECSGMEDDGSRRKLVGRKGEKRQKYRLYENMPYRFNLNIHLLPWPLIGTYYDSYRGVVHDKGF